MDKTSGQDKYGENPAKGMFQRPGGWRTARRPKAKFHDQMNKHLAKLSGIGSLSHERWKNILERARVVVPRMMILNIYLNFKDYFLFQSSSKLKCQVILKIKIFTVHRIYLAITELFRIVFLKWKPSVLDLNLVFMKSISYLVKFFIYIYVKFSQSRSCHPSLPNQIEFSLT